MLLLSVVSALQARHKGLRLLGIPHWATPGDVSRMAERIGVDGIKTGKFDAFLYNLQANLLHSQNAIRRRSPNWKDSFNV